MNIANQGFPAFRADLNNALGALVSNSSGATAPSTTFAHQFWVDTAANPSILKIRNADNDAWITIGEIDQTDDKFNLKCANATILENLTLNAQGDLRFADSDSSHYVAFQAPATVSSNVTWTLPSADGTSGQSLVTNGSGTFSFASIGVPGITYLTSGTAATYTTPAGVRALYVEVVGGGGGGGGCDGQGAGTSAVARSGGGGGYVAKLITSPVASYTYTIGAGGTGGAAGDNNGTAGGASSFSTSGLTLTAGGGGSGAGSTGTAGNSGATAGGTGGTATGGDLNLRGSRATARSVIGGDLTALSAPGCAAVFGGGITSSGETNADNATNYGEGGGGASAQDTATNFSGGNGGSGVIRITEYY